MMLKHMRVLVIFTRMVFTSIVSPLVLLDSLWDIKKSFCRDVFNLLDLHMILALYIFQSPECGDSIANWYYTISLFCDGMFSCSQKGVNVH